MAIDKVLVAIDASDGGRKALDLAVDVTAGNPSVHLDVAYVVPIPLLNEAQMSNFRSILDLMMEDGKKLVEDAIAAHPDFCEHMEAVLLTGTNPATELVKLIDQKSYDLVVIGNRGLSGVKEYMGSVSHKVLHGSSAPVLIAK